MSTQSPQIQILQTEQEEEVTIEDFCAVLRRRWWWVFLVFVVVVCLAVVYVIITPREYKATAVIKIPTQGGGGLAAALGNFLPIGPSSDIATEIEIIKGRNIAEKVIKELELDKKEKNLDRDWRQIVSTFQKRLSVRQKGKANLIEIIATGDSPEEAKDIANQVAIEYIRLSEASSQKQWDSLISQMGERLKQVQADLERSRRLLHDYEAKEGITTAFSPLLIGAGASSGYGTQYMIPEVPQIVAELRANIVKMETQLEVLRESFSEEDPEIVNLKKQLAASKRKLQEERKKAIEKYNKQFGLTGVAAEVAFNQQLYASLVSKQEELKAQYIMQNRAPEITEEAVKPILPSKPRKKLILVLAAAMGSFLGLGLALLVEHMDSSVHKAEDITRFIEIPVLGNVPRLGRLIRRRSGKRSKRGRKALIDSEDLPRNRHIAELYKESYRMLQLELMAAVDGETEREDGLTLLVTSSVQGEGKSTVAANLAISMAQAGRKVLLVDAGCCGPSQHELFDLDNHVGLADILAGDIACDDAIRRTRLDNLHVITAGDGSSLAELLVSPRLRDVIDLLRRQFSVIIFDSSSVALSSGAVAIGSNVNGVVFVIKANDTQRDAILQTKQWIQNSGGDILGAVLNCAALEKKYYR